MCFKSAKKASPTIPPGHIHVIGPNNTYGFSTMATTEGAYIAECEEWDTECTETDYGACENGICCESDGLAYCVCHQGYQGTICEEYESMESKLGSMTLNKVALVVFVFIFIVVLIAAISVILYRKRRNRGNVHPPHENAHEEVQLNPDV